MTPATTPRSPTAAISYEDYLALPGSLQPTEVIDGVLCVMLAPIPEHRMGCQTD